ncbi:pilus assembly protein [Bordetella genomosp. 7]|uniref:pilus assembly protein n=1 Tax=Bordetella genomosp. 7 TaxID=1416805 RepID=UPI001482CC92|nr:pilus assembly protein [Bordetella genomosp. 7]
MEFAIAAPPLLLLAMLVIEATHWQLAWQRTYVALVEAARAGALHHGHPEVIARAFASHAGADAAGVPPTQDGGPAHGWRIAILQPAPEAVRAHARAGLRVPGAAGRIAASNDYQAEHHASRGAIAGHTIYDANTLWLRLTYPHRPLAPLTRTLLRTVADAAGPCARPWLAKGLLALRLELRIEMQSHPVDWHAAPAVRHEAVGYGAEGCNGKPP